MMIITKAGGGERVRGATIVTHTLRRGETASKYTGGGQGDSLRKQTQGKTKDLSYRLAIYIFVGRVSSFLSYYILSRG